MKQKVATFCLLSNTLGQGVRGHCCPPPVPPAHRMMAAMSFHKHRFQNLVNLYGQTAETPPHPTPSSGGGRGQWEGPLRPVHIRTAAASQSGSDLATCSSGEHPGRIDAGVGGGAQLKEGKETKAWEQFISGRWGNFWNKQSQVTDPDGEKNYLLCPNWPNPVREKENW